MSTRQNLSCHWFWESGESLLAQVRGGKSEHHRARCRVTPVQPEIHAGGDGVSRPDGQCHREYTARDLQELRVRVKRWCKRPPREAQATRHGKPHRVQGQIGNRGTARSAFCPAIAGQTGFGYRLLRQMILSPEEIRGRQKSAYSSSRTNFKTPGMYCHEEAQEAQKAARIKIVPQPGKSAFGFISLCLLCLFVATPSSQFTNESSFACNKACAYSCQPVSGARFFGC